MGKITCLKTMFGRKGKMKVTSADCAESGNFFETTEKDVVSKEGDDLYEISQQDSAAMEALSNAFADPKTDVEKDTMIVDSISKKLMSVPSIADWAKQEELVRWAEQNEAPCSEVTKTSSVGLFEFDTRGLGKMKFDEVVRYGEFATSFMNAGEAVGEVAYEGDEDEEFEKDRDPHVIRVEPQSDGSAEDQTSHGNRVEPQSDGSGSGEHLLEEQRSGCCADNGTVMYYEIHSNEACVSDTSAGRFFEEEAVGDYVSDPGVYYDNESGLGRIDKDLEESHYGSQSQDVDFVLKKARSEGGLCDLGLISHQDPGHPIEQDAILLPQGNPSLLTVSSKDLSIMLSKSVVNSSHSEVDLREDFMTNVRLSEDDPSILKQKPWWKVFLVTHRNIHREQKPLVASSSVSRSDRLLVSAATGYSSDVDYCSRSRQLGSDAAHSEGGARHPESVRSELSLRVGEVVECNEEADLPQVCAKPDDATEVELSRLFQDVPLCLHSKEIVGDSSSGKELPAPSFDKPDLSRVEEWISSIDLTPFPADEEGEITEIHSDTEPSTPAASFFRGRPSRSDQVQSDGIVLVDRRTYQGDQLADADGEMANLIARSVNPLSTVAHFSGVGLKVVPPLGMHINLKTLNLSANSIVRIVPGCLPKSLHSLDLSRNKISVLEGLRELSRLRVLNLSYNRILRIGHGLANCTSLRELHLAGNKISEVEGLHRLLKLSYIDLSFNKLASAKSIGQLAANYNSLQAINLLGNPLHSNLGEEALRKLVVGLAPHVVYLNKQAMKAVSARDATVDSVARAALATTNHHSHQRGKTSTNSRPLRRGGTTTPSVASTPHHHREKRSDKSGTAHGGSRTSLQRNKAPSELASRHRHSHSRHSHGLGLVKDLSFPKPSPVVLSTQNVTRGGEKAV